MQKRQNCILETYAYGYTISLLYIDHIASPNIGKIPLIFN